MFTKLLKFCNIFTNSIGTVSEVYVKYFLFIYLGKTIVQKWRTM
jgi:hypothetical protein